MIKKLIITLVILGIIGTGGYFGIKAYRNHRQNSDPVKVYSVSSFYGGYYDDESYADSMSGFVSSSGDQKICVGGDKVVSEVMVKEGDEVKVGDVILVYDNTQESLKLDSLRADLTVMNNELTMAHNTLEKLKQKTPKELTTTEATTEITTTEATTEATTQTTTEATTEEHSPSDPKKKKKKKQPTTEPSTEPTTEPYEEDPDDDFDDFDDFDDADPDFDDDDRVYTQLQLNKMIREQTQKIKEIQNKIDTQNLNIRKQERVLGKSEVTATVSGKVIVFDMSDERTNTGEPNIVISSSGTYTATVSVGEYNLEKMQKGADVTVYNYDSGSYYTGKVVDVGTTPNGEIGSPVVQSTYPVKIAIDDSEGLTENSYVEVKFDKNQVLDQPSGDTSILTVPLFMTRKENGKYYVMKDVNGRLQKQVLKTGKIYWGSDIVVNGGLTTEDKIAFPYGKDVVIGKICKEADASDLWE